MQAPAYNVDFYGDDFIRDPWPRYAEMRRLGAVLWLPRLENFALTRHREVRAALQDHATFQSGRGVAADTFGCEFLRGNTVASDSPRHDHLRRAMAAPLLPGALSQIQQLVRQKSNSLIDALLEQGHFDAMANLARFLPLTIVRDLVGLPDDGQENMLKWAGAAFDVLGIQNARGQAAKETVYEMRRFIQAHEGKQTLKPGSWTHRIQQLVTQDALSPDLASFAIRDYINPSLDTTISATGELIWQIAHSVAQWEEIKAHPELAVNAANEAVRLGSPIRSFTRTTAAEARIAGVDIPKDARVMMIFAAANRDERVFPDPDQFDIHRDPKLHLGFGSGIHMCVGMHLAQLEMIALLQAMIPRVKRIHVGKPTVVMNNTIHAFATLPAYFEAETRSFSVLEDILSCPSSDMTLYACQVVAREDIATGIIALEIAPKGRIELPPVTPGSHLDVHIRPGLVRQYSLTGNLKPNRYRIAIQKEPRSKGGSRAMHDRFQRGSDILIGHPRNQFALTHPHKPTALFAGGIGITPLLPMAWDLHQAGTPFALHISVKSRARLAFADELAQAPFAKSVHVYAGDELEQPRTQVGLAIQALKDKNTQLYICGPAPYMTRIRAQAIQIGLDPKQIRQEQFGPEINADKDPFEIIAARSKCRFTVHSGQTILSVLEAAGIQVQTSCRNGVCGSCLTPVLAGVPEHRDFVQTDDEKARNHQITVCCSRAKSKMLTLDI